MTATFAERMHVLRQMTGMPEDVVASVTVDQVYAHYQHEHLEFRHPRGGRAKYLELPFYDHFRMYLHDYGHDVLRDGGIRSLGHSMEHLSDQVEVNAPREFGDLMRSGHPMVRVGAETRYDRAPKQHRLSKAELRIKNRLRHLPPEIIGYIWWHVMHHQEPPPHLRRRG
jgi:hypothetical protein